MRVPSIAALAFVAALSPAGAVTLTFAQAPDITFEIPAGWSACDAVTRTALQGREPKGQLKDLCKDSSHTGGGRTVGSPDGSVMMSFVLTKPDEFPPSYFKTMTAKKLSGMQADMCRNGLPDPADDTSCSFTLREISSRRAIFGRVHQKSGRFDYSRMVIVPGRRRTGYFVLMARWPNAGTDAGMDAIVASIHVSAEAKSR